MINPGGISRILSERERQQTEEGFTADHDMQHIDGALIAAAECYLLQARDPMLVWPAGNSPMGWPWSAEDWKPSNEPIRNLEKAGALIAAEIDRQLRS